MWKGIVGKSFTAEEFYEYAATIQMGEWRPQFVVLHNTASPKLSQWHQVPGETRMKNLEHEYRDIQHWSAGPHLFIADDASGIWAFTPLTVSGVHSPSWNSISWGVETVGDFDTEILADAQRANLIAALAALHVLGGLDPDTLKLHHEDPRTTHRGCPGKNIVKADVIQWVKDALASQS